MRRWLVLGLAAISAMAGARVFAQSAQAPVMAGTWVGPYAGQDSGTITIGIDAQGKATCSLSGKLPGQEFSADGSVMSAVNAFDQALRRESKSVRDLTEANLAKLPEDQKKAWNEVQARSFTLSCETPARYLDVLSVQGSYIPPVPDPATSPNLPPDTITGTWTKTHQGSHHYATFTGTFKATLSMSGAGRATAVSPPSPGQPGTGPDLCALFTPSDARQIAALPVGPWYAPGLAAKSSCAYQVTEPGLLTIISFYLVNTPPGKEAVRQAVFGTPREIAEKYGYKVDSAGAAGIGDEAYFVHVSKMETELVVRKGPWNLIFSISGHDRKSDPSAAMGAVAKRIADAL